MCIWKDDIEKTYFSISIRIEKNYKSAKYIIELYILSLLLKTHGV